MSGMALLRFYGFVDSELIKRIMRRIYENFIEKEKHYAKGAGHCVKLWNRVTHSRDQMSNAPKK